MHVFVTSLQLTDMKTKSERMLTVMFTEEESLEIAAFINALNLNMLFQHQIPKSVEALRMAMFIHNKSLQETDS